MRATWLSMLAALFMGCGSSNENNWERIPLTGVVNRAGEQLSGNLTLVPLQGTRGPSVSASIDKGAFSFSKKTGPVAGAHKAILRLQLGAQPANVLARQPPDRAKSSPTAATNSGGGASPELLPRVEMEVNVPGESPYEIKIDIP